MATKTSTHRAPRTPAPSATRTPSTDGRLHQPEVHARLDEAARLVAEQGHAQFAHMTAPELLQWLRANNRMGYGNLVRALFKLGI